MGNKKIKVISRITPMGLVMHEYYSKPVECIFYKEEELDIPCRMAIEIMNYHTQELQRRFMNAERGILINTKDIVESN